MQQALLFRPAGLPDIGRLLDLQQRAMRALAASSYSAAQIAAFNAHIAASTTALVARRQLHLAECAGEIAACGGWTKDHGEVGLGAAAQADGNRRR